MIDVTAMGGIFHFMPAKPAIWRYLKNASAPMTANMIAIINTMETIVLLLGIRDRGSGRVWDSHRRIAGVFRAQSCLNLRGQALELGLLFRGQGRRKSRDEAEIAGQHFLQE